IGSPAGIYAGISVLTGDGVTINAGATDLVTLRGLSIHGLGGDFGVLVFSVGILNVEGCVIGGLANTALNFVGAGQLFLSDTVLSASFFGLRAEGVSAGSRAHVSVHNCQIKNNFDGIIAFDYVRLSASDSMITGNVGGVTEDSDISSAVNVTLNNCLIANNSFDGIGNAG